MSKYILSDLPIIEQVRICTERVSTGHDDKYRQDAWNRLVAIVQTGYNYKAVENMFKREKSKLSPKERRALRYIHQIELRIRQIYTIGV